MREWHCSLGARRSGQPGHPVGILFMLPCKSEVAQLQQSQLLLYLFMPKFARRCPSGCWAGGSAQPAPLLAQGVEPEAKARQSHGPIHHSGAEPTELHIQAGDGCTARCLSWVPSPCLSGGEWAMCFAKHRHGAHGSAGGCTFIQLFQALEGKPHREGVSRFFTGELQHQG